MLSGKCRRDKSVNNIRPALDFFSVLPPGVSGSLSPASDLGEIHPREPALSCLYALVLKELGPKARATSAHRPWQKILRSVFPWSVVTGCMCVCVCASVGVCAWFALCRELRVGGGGGRWRDVKFSATQ